MIDPLSVVREGEFATAEQTAGIPARVVNAYNKVVAGTRLNPEQRQDFLQQAELLFGAQRRSHIALEDQFRGLAERQKFDPSDVVIDFVGEFRKEQTRQTPSGDDFENSLFAMEADKILKLLTEGNLTNKQRDAIEKELSRREGG